MKRVRFALDDYMKSLRILAGLSPAIMALSVLPSCQNDIADDPSNSGYDRFISFGLSSDAQRGTRSSAAHTDARFVLRSPESSDTLCMRAVATDGIMTGNGDNDATRAARVSSGAFYDNFHVFAYWKQNGSLTKDFYMNTVVKGSGTGASSIWRSDEDYYWPGENQTLQFRAVAPNSAVGLTLPDSPASTLIDYTVPDNAAEQQDVVVAVSEELQGNHNTAVPLTFNHLCSAVQFVTGATMQRGSIKSVTINNVKYSGTYDMASNTGYWTLANYVKSFSQTIGMQTSGSEANGTPITDATNGFFMMLPQDLGANASVEVVFERPNGGGERTLTASLSGTKWEMGKTYTYRLSVTPEYELEFVSEPPVQDAHYVICPVTIKADKLPADAGGWTLSCANNSELRFVEYSKYPEGIQSLLDQGFWLKNNTQYDFNAPTTLTSTTTGQDIKVLVMIPENVGDAARDLQLTLRPAAAKYAVEANTLTIQQLCPSWNGNLGVERMQAVKDYPWGFNWDASMKITYQMPGKIWGGILYFLFEIFGDKTYVHTTFPTWSGWTATVDFSNIKLDKASSETDGLTNTWQLYTFDGINDASTIMNQLESWGGKPDLST